MLRPYPSNALALPEVPVSHKDKLFTDFSEELEAAVPYLNNQQHRQKNLAS